MFIRRILVPTDFSPRSRQAVVYAIGLAAAEHAEVTVLHVVPAPGMLHLAVDAYLGLPIPSVPSQILDRASELLDALVSSLSHDATQVSGSVEAADPAATIVRMAVETSADVIVMGTHARTRLAEALLGSVAHRVITCAPCPVMTLRGDEARPHADAR